MAVPTETIAPPSTKAADVRPVLSDAVAGPVPSRSKPLRKPTHAEANSKLKSGLGEGVNNAIAGGSRLEAVQRLDASGPEHVGRFKR